MKKFKRTPSDRGMKQIAVELEPELYTKVKHFCVDQNSTITQVVRVALEEYMSRRKK